MQDTVRVSLDREWAEYSAGVGRFPGAKPANLDIHDDFDPESTWGRPETPDPTPNEFCKCFVMPRVGGTPPHPPGNGIPIGAPGSNGRDTETKAMPDATNAVAWATTRHTGASVADRVGFRLMNRRMRCIGHLGSSNVYAVPRSLVEECFPDVAQSAAGRDLVMVETSFATINESHFRANVLEKKRGSTELGPSEMSKWMFAPDGRMRRVLDQCVIDPFPGPTTDVNSVTSDGDTVPALAPYQSPLHTLAQPFASSRLHALAYLAEGHPTTANVDSRDNSRGNDKVPHATQRGVGGVPQGHGIQAVLAHWVCSGPGTTRLFPWSHAPESKPFVDAYFNSVRDGQASVQDWTEILLRVAQSRHKGGMVKLVGTMVAECALLARHTHPERPVVLPLSPDDGLKLIKRYLANVWQDGRVADFRVEFESLLAKHMLFFHKSFYDTVQYTLQEASVDTLAGAMLRMETPSTPGVPRTSLTVPEMRSVSVWVVQALVACVHLQGHGVDVTHGGLSFENLFLVPDRDPRIEYYHHTLPSAIDVGRTFSLYLPRVQYGGVPVHCVLGHFDTARSGLHGVGAVGRSEVWRDPLTLASERRFYSKFLELMDHSYAKHRTQVSGSRGRRDTKLYESERRDVRDSQGTRHSNTPDSMSSRTVSANGSDSENEGREPGEHRLDIRAFDGDESGSGSDNDAIETPSHSSEVPLPNRVDFPTLDAVLSHISATGWVLDESGTPRLSGRKGRKKPLNLHSLTPAYLLETCPNVMKHFGRPPPASATVHSFAPMAPAHGCVLPRIFHTDQTDT